MKLHFYRIFFCHYDRLILQLQAFSNLKLLLSVSCCWSFSNNSGMCGSSNFDHCELRIHSEYGINAMDWDFNFFH